MNARGKSSWKLCKLHTHRQPTWKVAQVVCITWNAPLSVRLNFYRWVRSPQLQCELPGFEPQQWSYPGHGWGGSKDQPLDGWTAKCTHCKICTQLYAQLCVDYCWGMTVGWLWGTAFGTVYYSLQHQSKMCKMCKMSCHKPLRNSLISSVQWTPLVAVYHQGMSQLTPP